MKKSGWLWIVVGLFSVVPALANESAPHTDILTDPAAADQVPRKGFSSDTFIEGLTAFSYDQQAAEGRSLARVILSEAYAKLNNDLFVTVFKSLEGANIVYPKPGYDFQGCSEGVLAFVLFIGGQPQNNMYLCSLVFGKETRGIAQTIIHESAHVAGLSNECHATIVEVAAMRLSGRGLSFQNGYMSECGIQ